MIALLAALLGTPFMECRGVCAQGDLFTPAVARVSVSITIQSAMTAQVDYRRADPELESAFIASVLYTETGTADAGIVRERYLVLSVSDEAPSVLCHSGRVDMRVPAGAVAMRIEPGDDSRVRELLASVKLGTMERYALRRTGWLTEF